MLDVNERLYLKAECSITLSFKRILLFVCVCLVLLLEVTGNEKLHLIFISLSILSFFLVRSLSVTYISLLLIVGVFVSISCILQYNSSVLYLLNFISTLSLGYSISRIRLSYYHVLSYYILLSVYFSYKLYVAESWEVNAFAIASRNYISIYMISAISLFLFSSKSLSSHSKFDWFVLSSFIILCVLISVWSGSRSGALASMFLLPIILFSGINKRTTIVGVSTLLMSLLVYTEINGFSFEFISRIEQLGLNDSGRAKVIMCYYENLDVYSLLFGLNFPNNYYCGTLANGEYSLHNSYLSLFTLSGIGGGVVLFITAVSISKYLKWREYVFLFSFVAILIRAATDTFLFFFPRDFIFWCFVFHALNVLNKDSRLS